MIRILATIGAFITIGCAPDVHVNPTAAGVEEFRDAVAAYETVRDRERDALPDISDAATAANVAGFFATTTPT